MEEPRTRHRSIAGIVSKSTWLLRWLESWVRLGRGSGGHRTWRLVSGASVCLDAERGGVGWLDSCLGQSSTSNREHQSEDPAILI